MSSKTVLETLEAARKLIEKPESWMRHKLSNSETTAWSSDANCWCAVGALCAINRTYAFSTAEDILKRVMGMPIPDFNDTHTHAEVLRAFDAAIAKEREAQHVL